MFLNSITLDNIGGSVVGAGFDNTTVSRGILKPSVSGTTAAIGGSFDNTISGETVSSTASATLIGSYSAENF